jgi:hypothetical protein
MHMMRNLWHAIITGPLDLKAHRPKFKPQHGFGFFAGYPDGAFGEVTDLHRCTP